MMLQRNNSMLVYILMVGVFSILNTEMGIIGLLPGVSERFGVSISSAGMLVSLFALTVAVAGPTMPVAFSGLNRRTVMLLVLGVFFISNLFAAVTDSFALLLGTRIFAALLHPVYCALAFTTAAESVPPEKSPQAVARVFIGVSAGMVIGVPISNLLAAVYSYSAAMLMFAAVNLLAFAATLLVVPSLPAKRQNAGFAQYRILRKPAVIMAILFVILLNGSVFGVFSYLADYLQTITQAPLQLSGTILFLYGAANIVGSMAAGVLLSRWPLLTVRFFPLLLAIVYGLIFTAGSLLLPMLVLTCIWGVLGGISANITQYWIVRAAPEAPDLANGLFLTAANLGTTVGAAVGGVVIAYMGLSYLVCNGLLFLGAAAALLAVQLKTAAGSVKLIK